MLTCYLKWVKTSSAGGTLIEMQLSNESIHPQKFSTQEVVRPYYAAWIIGKQSVWEDDLNQHILRAHQVLVYNKRGRRLNFKTIDCVCIRRRICLSRSISRSIGINIRRHIGIQRVSESVSVSIDEI